MSTVPPEMQLEQTERGRKQKRVTNQVSQLWSSAWRLVWMRLVWRTPRLDYLSPY